MAANPDAAATAAAADAAKTADTQQTTDTTKTADPAAAATAAANQDWFYADGVKGTGPRPDWYKGDKYKTLAEQARAYPEVEKKVGELTAKVKSLEPKPPPEKYELPDLSQLGGDMEWKKDDPLLAKAFEVAKKHSISQEVFNALAVDVMMPIIRNYEMIDIAAEKAALGDRADERMDGITAWAKANLPEEQQQLVLAPLGRWSRPHEIFAALEAVLTATKQPHLHKPGDDVATGSTRADWEAKWYAKSDKPGCQYKIDEPGNREKARTELTAIVGTGDHVEVVGKR
jgi:hypothetical protein